MSLQQRLEKFQKQQEKCQSTLSSIASEKHASAMESTPPHMNYNVPNATPASVWPPAPTVKFSCDTVRLQFINNIRKSPVSAQIKRVIDLLFERREAFTPEQINQACYVLKNNTVFESLTNNLKVHYDGNCFSYKPKHEVKNKEELLRLIQEFPEGIPVIDLMDSYLNVKEDLQTLKTDRNVWLLSNKDSQDVVYPNETRFAIIVDDDVKNLFRSIELPRDFLDIEKELLKSGVKPLTNIVQRRAAAPIQSISSKPKPKKKKREISKRTKLTNTHMPELFSNLS